VSKGVRGRGEVEKGRLGDQGEGEVERVGDGEEGWEMGRGG